MIMATLKLSQWGLLVFKNMVATLSISHRSLIQKSNKLFNTGENSLLFFVRQEFLKTITHHLLRCYTPLIIHTGKEGLCKIWN